MGICPSTEALWENDVLNEIIYIWHMGLVFALHIDDRKDWFNYQYLGYK